ncbi:hypothetical protein DACRYDRAFT_20329 [Dacryopinax primogenitus]|uniref:Mid2 domain-containing protein n=1 Tax=Dacryopinax primogenitus (strain DJM 731) TaxID=1858805 RepID=M5G911_DACPD|nr:uncharacterized protein DACRYDRAFT_20329 [Dacryopinax primogenitus]EJU04670.1 hypothetical protein DACRYDRAFT_20329 [Dacryopinax primogenitus]
MSSSVILLSLIVLVVHTPSGWAQSPGGWTNTTCTTATWEFNSQDHTPCLMWAQLQSLCVTDGVEVTALPGADFHYTAPSANQQPEINDCNCNVVSYNLMAACTWCQPFILTSDWITEAQWRAACPSYSTNGVSNVASASVEALQIPGWAFLPNNGAAWNPNVAYAYVSTASLYSTTSSVTSTSTSSAAMTTTSTSTSASASASSGDQSGGSGSGSSGTNIGPIVGGVVGGVGGLLLIALLVILIMRWRRKSAAANAAASAESARLSYAKADEARLSQYSTRPGTSTSPGISTSPTSTSPFSQTGFYGVPPLGMPYGNDGMYTGLPEPQRAASRVGHGAPPMSPPMS